MRSGAYALKSFDVFGEILKKQMREPFCQCVESLFVCVPNVFRSLRLPFSAGCFFLILWRCGDQLRELAKRTFLARRRRGNFLLFNVRYQRLGTGECIVACMFRFETLKKNL